MDENRDVKDPLGLVVRILKGIKRAEIFHHIHLRCIHQETKKREIPYQFFHGEPTGADIIVGQLRWTDQRNDVRLQSCHHRNLRKRGQK